MDPNRFDALARVLSVPDSRRRVLGLLTAVPVVGGVLSILTPEETDAAGRRKRRKKARNHKKKKPTCTPTTCAAQGKTCGSIPNGCGKILDCGPCTCATGCHPVCQVCNPATGLCDAVANDTPCNDGDACTQTDTCQDGTCVGTDPVVCLPPDQCHKQGVCDPNTGVCSNPEKCSGGQICQSDGTCCLPDTADLQAAIDGAASGDTIPLCAGTWALTAAIEIANKDLTLIGAGTDATVLDGGNNVQVLSITFPDVTLSTVTLQDLTITKGSAAGTTFLDRSGGGINNQGNLTLRGVNVTENTATYGGGIYNHPTDGTVTLKTGSSVSGNTATYGGGIFNSGIVTLETGSSVSGNTANEDGGGIYIDFGPVTLETGSSVSGNGATQGGGIYNYDGTVTLDSGAIICSNTPLNDQCSGLGPFTGTCPFPSQECSS